MKVLLMEQKNYNEAFCSYVKLHNRNIKIQTIDSNASEADLKKAMKNVDVIITNNDYKFPVKYLDYCHNLKLLHSSGVGFNQFPLEECKKRGIYVCNCKGMNAISVAEHTIMMMLMLVRNAINIHTNTMLYKTKSTEDNTFLNIHEMKVGLIGLGDVGLEVSKRLHSFGATIYYYDIARKDITLEKAFNLTYLPLYELLHTVDVVSLHIPVNEETQGIVNEDFLNNMKPTAYLINCALGGLVDNKAMKQALKKGTIAGAGLDTIVLDEKGKNPLLGKINKYKSSVVFTPHIAGCGHESLLIGIQLVYENIERLINGFPPKYSQD